MAFSSNKKRPRISTNVLHRLTPREVQAAKVEIFDGGGLSLRVDDVGARWNFRFTSPAGRRRNMGLGPCNRSSLAACGASLATARDLAHEARQLLQHGEDPIDARDARRQAARQADAERRAVRQAEAWTLGRCADDYCRRVIEPNRTTKHALQWIASLRNHIPRALWQRPIDDIKPPELLGALTAAKPHAQARHHKRLDETLRRVRQRLDAICEDAIFHGRASTNPAAAIARKLVEARPQDAAGEHLRALDWREAPALYRDAGALPGLAPRALQLAMLTAGRTSEVLGARWSEIDLAAAIWTVPAERMKANEEHVVALSRQAVAILQALPRVSRTFVFPSPNEGAKKPLSAGAMVAVIQRAGWWRKTTVHGLRATFSTWANELGVARPDVIEVCLAHREADKVRRAYSRAQFNDERRALLQRWAAYLEQPEKEGKAAGKRQED